MATNKSARRIMAIFCLMLIISFAFPDVGHAQAPYGVFEFPLGRSNEVYSHSMNIVLNVLGQGQNRWTLHKGTNSFIDRVGCLEDTCGWNGDLYPVLYFDGVATPAPGACDIASYFMKVAQRYGLSWDKTLKHGRPLYGVEEEFWISIWNPGQDAWVVNPYDHDIAFVWSIEGTTLRIWMEGLDGSPLPPSENVSTAIQNSPVDTSMDGEFVLDEPLFVDPSLESIQPTLQPVEQSVVLQTSSWEPQNDIAIINARYPAIKTDYVETTYPLGIAIHHTVGNGGGDALAASAGVHPNGDRSPYGIVIGKDGVAHLIAKFGSKTNHARCNNYGVVGQCANTDYASIAVVGDYRYDVMSPAQEEALVNSIRWLIANGAAPKVYGHRDVGKLNGYGTECPGDNIYFKLPELLARANAEGIGQKMEGEFILDPSFYDGLEMIDEEEFGKEVPIPQEELQPEITAVEPQMVAVATDLSTSWTMYQWLLAIGAVLLVVLAFGGGIFIILGVPDHHRIAAIAIVGSVMFVLICSVAGIGYYVFTKPPPAQAQAQQPTLIPIAPTATVVVTQPTALPDDFVGTGGDNVEYIWEDPFSQFIVPENLENPIIPYTESSPLSPVFWYFAVGQKWGDQIPIWSAVHGLDPNLTATFMLIESGGNPLANCPGDLLGYDASTEGNKDKGLFQLNPKYFENGCDFNTNVFTGPQYIRSRMDAAGGNLAAAAAGYNGGPKALEWFLASSDPSSSVYQQKRAEYVTFLNGLGYNGSSKAAIVEKYVNLVVGVYMATKSNSTSGLENFLSPRSYAGSVAKAYGLPWPPVQIIPTP